MRFPAGLCILSWLVGAACATAPPPGDPIVALRARASSELSCPADVLRIAPLGQEVFAETRQPLYQEVQGCSLHVIYVATKAGYVMSSPQPARPSLAPDHVDVR